MSRVSRVVLSAFVCLFFAPAAFAEDAKPAAKAAKPKPVARLVTIPVDQLKWEPNPGAPEVKMATVWGDVAKGPHGAFHKFPAGFSVPLHTHSADIRAVVISGTMIEGTEDGKETKLPPGSYFYQPHGVKHVTKCDAGSECVIFGTVSGKFDVAMVEAPKK